MNKENNKLYIENDIENIDESSKIEKPFDPTKIDITIKPLNIDLLVKRMSSKPMRIKLNPEFQRRMDLWDKGVQSRLIESMLIKIPLPAFYFDGTNEKEWLVVDGLQRLNTLKNFIIDKKLKLTDLEYLTNYEDCHFDDLPEYLQSRIEETHVTAYIINPGTPKDVKFNLFKRINTGGLILKPQEIRHALHQGIPVKFIKELANLNNFKKATDNSLVNSKRMEDFDFVTRFVAFYMDYKNYEPDLDSFLNRMMDKLNEISKENRARIKHDFDKSMRAAYDIFQDYAFRKFYTTRSNERRNPLNKAIFDCVSVNLAYLNKNEIQRLLQRKKELKKKFARLINKEGPFFKSITSGTGDTNSVRTRFKKIKDLFQEVLND